MKKHTVKTTVVHISLFNKRYFSYGSFEFDTIEEATSFMNEWEKQTRPHCSEVYCEISSLLELTS